MNEAAVDLKQESGYRFAIGFGAGIAPLEADEPAPLGTGAGPSPVQLLAAAVGNCLSASLVFALRKFKLNAEPVSARVEAVTGRNEKNRLRVQRLKVNLALGARAADLQHLDKVLAQFEDFCTVTQSVRAGIEIDLEVRDAEGVLISRSADAAAGADS